MLDLTTFSLALYKFYDSRSGARPSAFCGSAFVVHGGIMITCRHCFEDYPLGNGEWYGAVYEKPDKSDLAVARIDAISYDPSGADLATAACGLLGSPLTLTRGLEGVGHDVGTIGHPGTYGRLKEGTSSGPLQFDQQSRWMQGYVTRGFHYERPDGKLIPSWELDMPAPSGLSGSPVLLLRASGSSPVFIGVVYGAHSVPNDQGSADAMASDYPFALAHIDSSLRTLRGELLGSKTLEQYLERYGMMSDAVQR